MTKRLLPCPRLTAVACAAALLCLDAAAVMLPLFAIVFGDFTNVFGTYIPPCFGLPPIPGFMTDQEFNRAVSDIALKFVYLAIGAQQSTAQHMVTRSARLQQPGYQQRGRT